MDGPPVAPALSPRWRFRPRRVGIRSERSERFGDRLATALEAGHSLAGELRLFFRSGPHGGIEAEVLGGSLGRWWAGSVLSLFSPGQWSVARERRELPGRSWVGRPRRRFPSSLWHLPPNSVAERLGGVLGSLAGGLTLSWTLSPSSTYTEVEPLAGGWTPRTSPALPSVRYPRRPVSPPLPLVPQPRPAQRVWATQVALYRAGRGSEVRAEEREAVERSLWGGGDNGVKLVRPRGWPFQGPPRFPLRGSELLALLPEPSGVGWPVGEEFALPPERLGLGENERGRPWDLPLDAANGRHLAVLGETGMGKSSFLVTLAATAARKHGVVLLDPMGEAARQLLTALPQELSPRVTWLSAADSSAGLNALALPSRDLGPAERSRRITDLVEALRRVRAGHFVEHSFWGPRIEEMLARALSAAASTGGTLVDAHAYLEEATGRAPPEEGAPVEVRTLFERVRQRPDDAEGAKRLLYEFTSNPDLVRLLCDTRSALRGRDLVLPGALTVVSGDAPRVGETTTRRLLAALLSILWGELIARPRPAKTFVVLDEIQWFGHEALGEMLRLGRRFNVHVVLGTQSLHDLPEAMADAVRTNVADFLLFRGSSDEAREFSRMTPQLQPEDFLSLARGEAIFLEGKGRRIEYVRPRVASSRLGTGSVLARLSATAATDPSPVAPDAIGTPGSTPRSKVRVYLSELPPRSAGSGDRVRDWGGVLGRSGSILGRGRDSRGPYWELTEEGSRWLRRQERGHEP